MRNDPSVTDLVTRARTGDKQAWDVLVDRYVPLVWSICRRYQLGAADAQDAGQSVWLHLVQQLSNLRDPAALPGWLAATTRHECARVLRAANRPQAAALVPDVGNIPDDQAATPEQELLVAERHAALREALTHLPPRGQQLLTLLLHDPPLSYSQISATLGTPVGSIGPLRRRYLHQLRRDPAIAALANAATASAADEQHGPGHRGERAIPAPPGRPAAARYPPTPTGEPATAPNGVAGAGAGERGGDAADGRRRHGQLLADVGVATDLAVGQPEPGNSFGKSPGEPERVLDDLRPSSHCCSKRRITRSGS